VRPHGMAKRVPRDSVFTRWPGEAWSPTGTCPDGANAVLESVRSPPLQERRPKVRWPRGGRPGDGPKGGFLGGTHSVRPRCEAPRMPRLSICSRWVDDEPVAERAHASVKPVPSYPGVRSPPLQERRSKARWPRGGRPGDDAKGGFLGGTHSVRPHGMAKRVPRNFLFTGWPGGAGSPTGTCLGQARAFLSGRAEPAPPRGGQAKARRPYGGRPGDGAKSGFLGGAHSVRPLCEAERRPRHLIPTTSVNDGPVA
jgi:hypothetical protein